MPPQTINKLSVEAMNDLRALVKEEIGESMTEEEIEQMGIRFLRFFYIMNRKQVDTKVKTTEQEQKALDYINTEIASNRIPTVRGIAHAVGLNSSRSGMRLRNELIRKGLMK